MRNHPDSFALVKGDVIVGLWSGRSDRPKTLGQERVYVVDYIEVSPDYRKGPWGVALFALCCLRAEELGVAALAVPSIPEVEGWYQNLGFVRLGNKYSWKVPWPLIAMLLRDGNFGTLLDLAHASLQEDEH